MKRTTASDGMDGIPPPPLGALYAREGALKKEKYEERCDVLAGRLYELLESAARRGGDDVVVVQGEQWWHPDMVKSFPRVFYLPDARKWFLALSRTFWREQIMKDIYPKSVADALHRYTECAVSSKNDGIYFASMSSGASGVSGVFVAFQEDVERRIRTSAERASASVYALLLNKIVSDEDHHTSVELTLRDQQPFGLATRQFWSHLETLLQQRLTPECLRVVPNSTRVYPMHTPSDVIYRQQRFMFHAVFMSTMSMPVILPLLVTLPLICGKAFALHKMKKRARKHSIVTLELEPTSEAWSK